MQTIKEKEYSEALAEVNFILEYTDKLIRIQTKLGKIHVIGRNLQIEFYTNDEMKIVGHIAVIEFHEGG